MNLKQVLRRKTSQIGPVVRAANGVATALPCRPLRALTLLALPIALLPGLGAAADPTGVPVVKVGRPALIAPADAEVYYGSATTSTSTYSPRAPTPNEVVELARALGNNVDEIYDFVRNYVDTVFIFGAQKGALGAIVDRSGTPFDQAELMVALLRQAAINNPSGNNYTAAYKYGTVTLTGAQFAAWTDISDARAACDLLASGGIPATINGSSASMLCPSIAAGTTLTTVTLDHIWVDVVIPGDSNHYAFDPSYKCYNFTAQVNLASAAGLTSGDVLTQATGSGYSTGTNSGVSFVKGLNAANITSKLTTYASNLQNYIQTQPAVAGSPLVSGKIIDLVGGREIRRDDATTIPNCTQRTGPLRQTSLPYTANASRTWTGSLLPSGFPDPMSGVPNQFRTTLAVSLTKADPTGTEPQIINNQLIFIDEVYGRTLVSDTLFLTGPSQKFTGSLNVVDEFGQGTTLSSFTDGDNPNYSIGSVTLTVTHPYAADAAGTTSRTGTYMDAVVLRNHVRYSTPFMIVHGWGEVSRGLIDKWGAVPNSTIPLMPPNGCETCSTIYFASKGNGDRVRLAASWLAQSSKAARLHATIAHSIYTHHHSIGIISGDTEVETILVNNVPTYNYTIAENFDRLDVESGFSVTALTSTGTSAADRRVAIHSIAATLDALEGSVAAQDLDLPDTVSTATRFDWGNNPPVSEDPSGVPSGSVGPRRFYHLTSAVSTSTTQSLTLVEGKTSTQTSTIPAGGDPTVGSLETQARHSPLAPLINTYTSLGFDVVASEEAFLGPGQRGGYFTPATGPPATLFTHQYSKQRGGAFVATYYDPSNNLDPIQIAHVAENIGDFGGYGIKGGGGGAQTL